MQRSFVIGHEIYIYSPKEIFLVHIFLNSGSTEVKPGLQETLAHCTHVVEYISPAQMFYLMVWHNSFNAVPKLRSWYAAVRVAPHITTFYGLVYRHVVSPALRFCRRRRLPPSSEGVAIFATKTRQHPRPTAVEL